MAILQPQDTNAPIKQQETVIQSFFNHDFLSLAFRPFFLLAAFFSISSLIMWMGYFLGFTFVGEQAMTPVVWHVHEMIFGFAATVAVGFVLTAAQTWTKVPSLSKGWIVLLIALWLSVRAGLYINSSLWVTMAIIAQCAWWLTVLSAFARQLITSKNKRNYILLPVMSLIALFNMAVISNHFIFDSSETLLHFSRTTVLVFVMLMGLMGGRVIPFFTGSGAKVPTPQTPAWLTPLVSSVSSIGAALYFVGYFVALPFTPATIMMLGGVLHLWRLSFWKTGKTITIPLLWSLHLSYFLMAIGMILLGLSYFTTRLAFSDALHMITIGAMGLMIFAMMTRVSLGHTGRALLPNTWVGAIYLLIAMAAFIRVGLSALNLHLVAWLASATCWIIASVIFLIIYTPLLWRNELRQ
jgi:uncharacterized protein involved in response to NO